MRKIWNDPVWSKVIAQGIIAILIFIGTIIWSFISAKYNQIDFTTAFISIWTYKVSLWIVALVIIMLFSAYWIFKNFKQKEFSYDEETIKLDQALFNKIRTELLPQEGSISFLRRNNFAGFSFDLGKIDDLDNIEYENRKSDFEFLNPTLEKLKEELVEKISCFTSEIAVSTFPTQRGFQTVPPEWEVEQPERFWKTVNKLHNITSEICAKYDELIRVGRRELKI